MPLSPLSSSLFLLFIVLSSTLACKTDEDCNLNGVCDSSGYCLCDYMWSGENCTTITFKPAPIIGSYGYAPNITAWGGIPVYVGGTYHLLVTEIINHCGLCTWGTNSRIVHATSNNLLGPFTYQNEALPVWAHNPHIVVDNSTGIPIYLLFHIGTANGGVTPKVCGNSTDKDSESDNIQMKIKAPAPSGILHTALSPAGPWMPQNPTGLESCNNPSPYVFPNGTIYLACSQGGNNIFTADSWKGPWKAGQLNFSGNPGAGIWEDPFIWRDQRGNWKMLAHVYPEYNSTAHFWDRVSGFAYSYDAFNWVRQPFQPYTNEIVHVNGTIGYTTRERPKIYFDPTDHTTPLALFNGVAEGTNCWDCKETCGVDWTYNIAVPIGA